VCRISASLEKEILTKAGRSDSKSGSKISEIRAKRLCKPKMQLDQEKKEE